MKKATLLKKLKPGARHTKHFFVAAFFWSVIGVVLILRGTSYLDSECAVRVLCIGVAAGLIKSFLILDKIAAKNVKRLQELNDGTCLGAVFSKKTWLLIICMSSMGMVLRFANVSVVIMGGLCIAIGIGLLFSSRHAWHGWYIEMKKERND